MIQNLIIIQDGLAIFNENFGDCHKTNSNPLLLSAFFDALLNFSYEFEQGNLEQVSFKNALVHFYSKDKLLFVAISDLEDTQEKIISKLKLAAKLFLDKYSEILEDYSGEISQFNDFRNLLLENDITQINCGKYTQCSYCQNKDNENTIISEIIQKN